MSTWVGFIPNLALALHVLLCPGPSLGGNFVNAPRHVVDVLDLVAQVPTTIPKSHFYGRRRPTAKSRCARIVGNVVFKTASLRYIVKAPRDLVILNPSTVNNGHCKCIMI
jgi:hypothetical protein